jgi:hypothetical protein
MEQRLTDSPIRIHPQLRKSYWIIHPAANQRLFGITRTEYLGLTTPKDKADARKLGFEQLKKRFESLIQRRHDCIHSCDRPLLKPQSIGAPATVFKVIQDVEFLVNRCDEHLIAEFLVFRSDEHLTAEIREFLTVTCMCLPATVNGVWY